jgi:NAD(P)-dependent dehydrogenase (short-subunit alcohol dehydrogenase family)
LVEVWKNFFRGQKSGHVVGVLSEAMGTPPWPHMTSYVIAKRGLQCLLECALAEFGTSGLQVDAFSVDYTETPMLLNVNEHVLAAARSKRPGGQLLKPHDVATAVVRRLNQPSGAAVLALEKIPQTNEPT